MKHWLTTHFRHHYPQIPWHVFLYHKPSARRTPSIGDPVFFYEVYGPGPGGLLGAKAIVRHGFIAGAIGPASKHGGGRLLEIPCTGITSGNPIPFRQIVANTRIRVLAGFDGWFSLDATGYANLLAIF